jgi:hypothetical protein
MKKVIFIILLLSLSSLLGCSGATWVENPLSLYDYIGDWNIKGTLNLDLEGRQYTQDVDSIIYIREGYISDNWGYTYKAMLNHGVLYLTKNEGFEDRDDYCGFFEGGTDLTYMFANVNPFFTQAYEGHTSGQTAVFTEHCSYKTLMIEGTAYLQKLD